MNLPSYTHLQMQGVSGGANFGMTLAGSQGLLVLLSCLLGLPSSPVVTGFVGVIGLAVISEPDGKSILQSEKVP